MKLPIISSLKKAIIEKRKQYLAFQYQKLKSELEREFPPKEIIEQAGKIRTSPEISKEQAPLDYFI